MTSSSKRSHTKSRRGCSQCKKKRIKCDETPPRCGSCTKHGLVCDYSQWTFFRNIHKEEQSDAKPRTAYKTAPTQDRLASYVQTPELNTEQLMLMHRYTLRTSLSLCRIPDERYLKIWQVDMPLLAHKYPFLMRGLLAVSALHAASEGEFDREIALLYYTDALHCFRTSYQVVRPEDGRAIVGFGIYNFIMSLAIGSQSELTLSDPIEGFLEPLGVLRRTVTFFHSIRSQVDENTLKGLLQERPPETFPMSEDASAALRKLEKSNETLVASEIEREICQKAIERLAHFFGIVSQWPQNWNFLIRWLISISDSFYVLLQQKHTMALVILAHWCVPVHRAPRRWWMGNWAERMVRHTANHLEPTWVSSIDWPLNGISEPPLED